MNDEKKAEGGLYCPLCADSLGMVKPRKVWLFSICFSILLLTLTGILFWQGRTIPWDISWDGLMGRPIAMINGEAIGRDDFMARLATKRRILELQYGEEIFTGEAGNARLRALKGALLGRMMEERLIAQEAHRLGLLITGEMVEQELQRIGTEIYGSGQNVQEMLGGDGVDEDSMKNYIRNNLTFQALAKAKVSLADKGVEPEVYFDAWLGQAKRMAKVTVYDPLATEADTSAGVGGCCVAGTSGCGASGNGGTVDEQTEEKAAEAALAEYRRTNDNTEGLTTTVSDNGCHIQVDIEKDGKIVKSYSYRDGRVFEI